ncbi:MAG TPA: signal peptide peptidase SppA [Pseudogracilibacillus sp.]|nr:signal peptide peptidase SppA [Pseudogracilibacillus sp.]
MKNRRWIALTIAIVLIFMSIGIRFTTFIASGFFSGMFDLEEGVYEELPVREGDPTSKIAIVNLDGAIMDLGPQGIFGAGYDHDQLLLQLEQAFTDEFVEGVILQVNSPGGGVHETAEIHRLIVELQEEYEKPLYVSMGGMAASGGYYVAATADKIFAEATTLTGSIGVIMESLNYAGLAEEYGIKFNTIKSGKHKDIMSPSREMTAEEREIMQSMIDEMYDEFVRVIVDGRQLDEKTVRKIGDGRIYTGKQAQEVSLVDEIGSLDDTIDNLMSDYELDGSAVVTYSSDLSFLALISTSVQNLVQGKSEIQFIHNLLIESDQPRAMYMY